MDIIVQVNISITLNTVAKYLNQISMNVMTTMVAVVISATTLKEALAVYVALAIN